MDLKPPQDTLTIDPIAMNVVNRVASGCQLNGDLNFEGGLLVQGELAGNIRINGCLIVWTGGTVRGRVHVSGDLYLFGRLGDAHASAHETSLECQGMVCVSSTGTSTGTLMARRLQLYEGADLQGPFKTLKPGDNLPVLQDTVSNAP
ncbi:MAG: polymer-forming cytoskeletal protein [Hydrogenophaga sp.]|jgi:cytoskeletal protein CcmA (bactofilin family)|uniref:bactofilin family protein n=1 Tax=Comamonadaceae TaxID=80864 RepID=UPI00271FE18F|nr:MULTISPECIES: polymer-forming cytoskeletal protein [Comamonadaceae]MDO9479844.1 polymer-forming cytoskeletal protein [Hydrogenophaga sp.]MDP2092817.1 polymer-forming cytoskeletal protein [Hydrogenophaga sp.]MDP3346247.1 polymer-forming cytoskeletal protein [Hydrogenophaga sp.]MDP3373441.1 polymer-forming cytoskeletal protein [Hydrogenophaga sp.]MDP3799380.1 polymer-forming cytoskeletal protein [Polaromonas sp.]